MKILPLACVVLSALSLGLNLSAEGLNADAQSKIDAIKREVTAWAASPVVVDAVRNQNQHIPADVAAMTQDKWQSLSELDPFVRAFTTNNVAKFLKEKKPDSVSEVFISDANGCKVAFLAKTTWWCHQG